MIKNPRAFFNCVCCDSNCMGYMIFCASIERSRGYKIYFFLETALMIGIGELMITCEHFLPKLPFIDWLHYLSSGLLEIHLAECKHVVHCDTFLISPIATIRCCSSFVSLAVESYIGGNG